jgi:hypothetical protein
MRLAHSMLFLRSKQYKGCVDGSRPHLPIQFEATGAEGFQPGVLRECGTCDGSLPAKCIVVGV